MYKKEMKEKEHDTKPNSTQVIVDPEKLKKGMAALFLSGDFDTDDFTNVLTSALSNIE